MAGEESKCCEKKLLYEIETPGLLYLSLDGKAPVYVGFQHRLKLEIRLVYPEGQSKTLLKSGILNPITPGLGRAVSKNFTDELKCLDARLGISVTKKEPSVQVSSPEINYSSDHEESKRPQSTSFNTSDASSAFKQSTAVPDLTKSPQPSVTSTFEVKTVKKTALKKKVNKVLHLCPKTSVKITVKEKDKVYSKGVREQAQTKLLLSKTQSNKETMVMSREQLEVFLKTSSNKNVSSEEISTNAVGHSGATKPDSEKALGQNSPLAQPEKPTTCNYCSQSFSTSKEFYKHRKYSVLNYHVCLKCNVAFPFRAYLLAHIKYHNEKGPRSSYDCDECKFKTSNFNNLKKHMIIHTREHSFQCCKCFKTFMTHTLLLKHLETHRPKGLFKCSCCNEYFPSRGALVDHKMIHQKLSCGLCGQVFPNRTSRFIHYQADHSDTILRCPQCDRMYSHREELAAHLKMHRQRKPQQCPICGAMVVRLINHLRSHKSVDEMPESELHMCDQCPKKFKTGTRLKNHMKTHKKEKVNCHLCSKSFPTRGGLSRHLYNVHSNLMRHQCEICGKQCKQKANLRVHMRIHSSVKLFPCRFCEQAFNYKASLDAHVRSKHFSESTRTSVNLNAQEAASNFLGPLNKVDTHDNGIGGVNALSTIFPPPFTSSSYSPQEITSQVHYTESSSMWIEPGPLTGNRDALLWTADMSKVSEPGLHMNTLNFVPQQNKDFQHQYQYNK